MGAADVVPGVSGGTMAFILGIYERLLQAIRSFDFALLALLVRRDFAAAGRRSDLAFLIPLLVGIGAALFVFTRIIPLPTYIVTDPEPVFSLFFGLVAASIVALLRDAGRLGSAELVWMVLGALAAIAVMSFSPASTPESSWFIFASGAVAICAMILPGISGSFILLMLKKYATVFDAVGRLDFAILLPFALGAICGLMVFSRFLVWLMSRFRKPTLAAIVGLLIGSLWMLWPFQQRSYEIVRGKERLVESTPIVPWESDGPLVVAGAWMLVGIVTVVLVHAAAKRRVKLA